MKKNARMTMVFLSAILAVGVLCAWWAVTSTHRVLSDDLSQQAVLVGQAIFKDSGPVKMLLEAAQDSAAPEYGRLKEHLVNVRFANPQCRFLHLLGRKADGTFFCVADSQPVGAKDYSPPGKVCEEISREYYQAFNDKGASVRGPYKSEGGGALLRAVVPVQDPSSGAVLAVLSMDVDAALWKWRVAVAGLLPVLVALVLMAVVLLFHLMRFRTAPWKHAEIMTVVVVGLILSLAAALLAYQGEERRQRSAFFQLAHDQAIHVGDTLSARQESELEALARLFESRQEISKSDFAQFASFLKRDYAVQAWEWIPEVSQEGLARFEQQRRSADAPDFGVWQKDETGNPVPAAGQPCYYPVSYVEPATGNERALGYDIGSDPIRRAALESARRTGLVTVTAPVRLVQETANQRGMLLFHPVFDRDTPSRLRGFAVSVLRLETMLRTSTAGMVGSDTVVMDLFDLNTDKPGEMLASTRVANSEPARSSAYSVTFPIFFSGRTFALVTAPSPTYEHASTFLTGWIVLLVGLVLTVAGAFVVGAIVTRRKELERLVEERTAALGEKNLRYELVLEGASGGIFDWDVTNDDINLSDGWKAMRGYDPAEDIDIGLDWKSTIHPDDAPRFWDAMDAHLAGSTSKFEVPYRICAKDGTSKHVVGRGKAFRDEAGRVVRVVGSEIDMTEREKMGEVLESERERLRNIINGTNVGTWEWNVQSGEIVINERWAEIVGYTLEELVPVSVETWERLTHPDDLRLRKELLEGHFQHESDYYGCEVRMKHRDGGWVWVMERGKVTQWTADGWPLRMFGTHDNVNARKRAEEKLLENETNLSAFFGTMTDLAMVCTHEGRILFVNRAFERKLGYSAEALTIMHVLDLHPAEHHAEAEAIFAAMFRGERDTCPLPMITKDGSYVPVETRVWFGKWNGKDCVFAASKDLSEEQEAQQRFERLFRNNPALMALSSSEDRRLTDVNDSFLAATGYARSELIGKTTAELGFFVVAAEHEAVVQQLKSTGRISQIELDVKCKNGEILHGLFSGEMIRSQGRGYLLSVMIDITERKHAEEKLRESELSYRNQFAKNTAVMLLVDPVDGAIIDANEAAQRFYGYTWERMQAMTVKDINTLPPQELLRAMEEIKDNKTTQFSFEHRLADGSVREVEVSSSRIHFGGRTVLHSIIHDVTDRKRAEHALRQTADRLSLATQAGGVGIWDYYVVQDKLVWDDQMFRLYGIAPDQFSGAYEAWQAGLHPEDRQRGNEEIQRALSGEKEFNTEFRVVWPNGSIHNIRALAVVYRDASGKPLRIIGTNWDITEIKQAGEEIRRQGSLINSLLDSIPDIIFFKEANGVYLGCNPPFAKFAGRSRDEIIGRSDYDLFDRETADFFRKEDRRMLALRKPRHNEEWITYPDGSRILIDTLKTPYWAADGTLIGVLGISRDITQRKRAEDELRRLNETIALKVEEQVAANMALERALIHQSRMAAIGEMLNNIAHQWRQPLNTLGISLANIQDGYNGGGGNEELVKLSMDSANRMIKRMSTTINDFRTFFQPNKELVFFSLREEIAAAVILVEPSFKSDGIPIQVIDFEDVMLYGISNEYSQVLLNLLMNARDAIMEHKVENGRVEIAYQETDGNACVIVRDNGGGISPEIIDRVFEPYFSTKAQGSGIGLYMSEMIMRRRMNGRIEARNIGGGAEMVIVTPLQQQMSEQLKGEEQ